MRSTSWLQTEDYVIFPVTLLQFISVFILLIFLNYAGASTTHVEGIVGSVQEQMASKCCSNSLGGDPSTSTTTCCMDEEEVKLVPVATFMAQVPRAISTISG